MVADSFLVSIIEQESAARYLSEWLLTRSRFGRDRGFQGLSVRAGHFLISTQIPMQVGLHVDANWHRGAAQRGLASVQGMVLATPQDAASGGLVVVPGSHGKHEDLARRYGDLGHGLGWYYVVPRDAPELAGLPLVLVEANAGSLILWDSRVAHAVVPPLVDPPKAAQHPCGAVLRLAAYVCMTPRAWATDSWVRRRWLAFHQRRATGHWPHFESIVEGVVDWDVAEGTRLHPARHVPPDVCRLVGRVTPPVDAPRRAVSLCAPRDLREALGFADEDEAARMLPALEARAAAGDAAASGTAGVARWVTGSCHRAFCDAAAVSALEATLAPGAVVAAAPALTSICAPITAAGIRSSTNRSAVDRLVGLCRAAVALRAAPAPRRCFDDPAPQRSATDDPEAVLDAEWVVSGAPGGPADAVDGFPPPVSDAPPLTATEAAMLAAARSPGGYADPRRATSGTVAVAVVVSGRTGTVDRTLQWWTARFLPSLQRAAGCGVELLVHAKDGPDLWKVARYWGALPETPLAAFVAAPPDISRYRGVPTWAAREWEIALQRRREARATAAGWYGDALTDAGNSLDDTAPERTVPRLTTTAITMWAGTAAALRLVEARERAGVAYAFVVRARSDVVVDAGALRRNMPWAASTGDAVYLATAGCGCNVRGPPDVFGVATGGLGAAALLRGPLDLVADLWIAGAERRRDEAISNVTVSWILDTDRRREFVLNARAGRGERRHHAASECAAAGVGAWAYDRCVDSLAAWAAVVQLAAPADAHRDDWDWLDPLFGGQVGAARAENPFAFQCEQLFGHALRRSGARVRVVPDLRYTIVRSPSHPAFASAPFRGRFFGAKCTLGVEELPWPPPGLEPDTASFFGPGEAADATEVAAGPPSTRSLTVVRGDSRVSLFAAGYTALYNA